MKIKKSTINLVISFICGCVIAAGGLFLINSSSGTRMGNIDVTINGTNAQKWDLAIIDIVGTIDGEEFEGGSADAIQALIGSGMMIPGFEEQIIGHEVGDVFDINVTFPEDYGNTELNGKEATFQVTLHEVWRNVATDLGENYYNPEL